MLEIVHDLAPDASLAFYGPSTSGDMASGIEQLTVAGCNVIVDDLTFFGEPTFQEGMLAQTIDDVTANGVVYATAAGNFADSSYQANFVSGGPIGGPTHDVQNFGGTAFQGFLVGPNSSARVFLYWSDPFDAPTDDFDLFVVDSDGNIVGQSDDAQDGTGTPLEIVQFTNASSSTQAFYTVVDRFSGNPQRLELVYTDVGNLQFATATSSIICNNTAPSALTVAAIDAHDPGNDTIEFFSSQGPCDYFFPSPVRLSKPDIAGIDGVAVTGAAGFGSPFFGTSAAAPHIAALAALALQANPLLTPLETKITLQRTSQDFGASGFDFAFGSGRANALLAARGVPIAEAAGFIGKKFAVRGNGFDPGAVLFVNGLPQKTKPLPSDPTRTLTSKKAAKLIHVGVTVTIEVRNPDGTTTGVLSFTPQ
jgi:subtilisin family serine protease